MAASGWVIDKSAAARANHPVVREQLVALAGQLYICPMGEREQLYSTQSAREYDAQRDRIHDDYRTADPPLPDLLIAETALHHDLGVVHVDGDFARIAEVRPLVVRRLG